MNSPAPSSDPRIHADVIEPVVRVPARYIMVGGFLGAGKTTAITQLAQHLHRQGKRVGLITNDQGRQLVDTALLLSHGFPVEEIAGGCFCCRFNSLTEAAEKLTERMRPEVFIAEPVGSCTDLVATVSYPLRRLYGNAYGIAPLSVFVDAVRARRVFGLAPGANFSEKVLYIYRKQLEEAELIMINKSDLVSREEQEKLRVVLRGAYPRAAILEVSARTGYGMAEWFARITSQEASGYEAMNVDYELYGEGEALLGWLNAAIRLSSPQPWDGNEVLSVLATCLQRELRARAAEVAHLKMTLDPGNSFGDVATVNLVRNDFVPEISQALEDPIDGGQLIVNLRAEAEPDQLLGAFKDAMEELAQSRPALRAVVEHQECFKPGRPIPVHRMSAPD